MPSTWALLPLPGGGVSVGAAPCPDPTCCLPQGPVSDDNGDAVGNLPVVLVLMVVLVAAAAVR